MDKFERLHLLSRQASLEGSEDLLAPVAPEIDFTESCPELSPRKQEALAIKHASAGNRKVRLLSTLLSSVCERNCYYCPFRAGRDFRRVSFKPDEFAQTFASLHKSGATDGVFLSSGIVNGGVSTQDKLLATAEILRKRFAYRGYLHLKLMPGVEKEQVWQALQLADRVSINLEAPNPTRLQALAPRKQFLEELLTPLRWVEEYRRTQPRIGGKQLPSSVTQFVVGAVGDSDLELLHTTAYSYRELRLQRVYFSAFRPIDDTPLQSTPATPAKRELRLYQASFLLRDYGFGLEDLPFSAASNLPSEIDPKLAWAQQNLQDQPIEINRAERQQLLRIPGIGPKGADAILKARRQQKIGEVGQLRKLGIGIERALPFVLLNGQRPEQQLALFS